MNAKKIMGAVLVALLAAALFVGAGAAAITAAADGTTVFVNQKLNATDYGGNWIGPNGAVATSADPLDPNYVYFKAAGVYTAKITSGSSTTEITVTVKAPEATISGIAGVGASAYPFIPGTLYNGDAAQFYITSVIGTYDVYLAQPGKAPVKVANDSTYSSVLPTLLKNGGEYSIILQYPLTEFVNGTTVDMIETQAVTFTVAKANDASITASANQILRGEPFVLTIVGQPGTNYSINYDAGVIDFDRAQISLNVITNKDNVTTSGAITGYRFEMPNTGKVEITVWSTSAAGKTETIKLVDLDATSNENKGDVTINFTSGAITDLKTDAASYFIGAKVTVTGITTAGEIKEAIITGNNFKAEFNKSEIENDWDIEYGSETEKTFKFVIPTLTLTNELPGLINGKLIDVGPYVVTLNTTTGAKASVALLMTQPFLSIISGPEVVIQDEDAEFIINAEATDNVRYYIFGNNYFLAGLADEADDNVDTHYSVYLNESQTDGMDEGQYFAVFQHPYLDGQFNVTYNGGNFIKVNGKDVIDIIKRQSANAAEALCVELDAQNIDDIYVKHSFFVVDEAESSYISDIPEEVAKGTTITVNGVDTANAGKPVTVQMLSTAFAAIPKEEPNLASFAVIVNTVIAEDGTWEVALETSDLAIDEYNVKVFIDGDEKKKAVTNVVAAGDEPVTPPTDDPVTPPTDEPEAPATPGFGALAALAGLGAVAVLLLRRE